MQCTIIRQLFESSKQIAFGTSFCFLFSVYTLGRELFRFAALGEIIKRDLTHSPSDFFLINVYAENKPLQNHPEVA
jgi:hypothetical protein